jgi:hypothetical protein
VSVGCPICTPLGISCEKGYTDPRKCPSYQGAARAAAGEDAGSGEDVHLVPWTGNSLGSRGLSFVAARGATRLLGIVGLSDAGKSTFLLMLYLLLARGHSLRTGSFAGSFTLGGWDHLARRMRLTSPEQPRFPPHTPIGAGRYPGMLHLRLRPTEGAMTDLLLTDASGEWFREWTVDAEASAAEGARWIVDQADAFLLVVDCARLSGEPRTVAAPFASTVRLAERLRDHAGGRRIGVVWAKADQTPLPEIRRRLEEQFARFFPDHASFEVTVDAVRDPTTDRLVQYLEAVDWVAEPRAGGLLLPELAANEEDLFLRIGRP